MIAIYYGILRRIRQHEYDVYRTRARLTGWEKSRIVLRAMRNRLRLASAQRALREEASIAEASVRAGFEDPNYFARWFRRQTGRSPSAFRDKN